MLGTSPCEKSISSLWFLFTISPICLYFNRNILHPLLSVKIFFHNLSSLRIGTRVCCSQILFIFFHQSIQLILFLLYFLTLYIFLNLFFQLFNVHQLFNYFLFQINAIKYDKLFLFLNNAFNINFINYQSFLNNLFITYL